MTSLYEYNQAPFGSPLPDARRRVADVGEVADLLRVGVTALTCGVEFGIVSPEEVDDENLGEVFRQSADPATSRADMQTMVDAIMDEFTQHGVPEDEDLTPKDLWHSSLDGFRTDLALADPTGQITLALLARLAAGALPLLLEHRAAASAEEPADAELTLLGALRADLHRDADKIAPLVTAFLDGLVDAANDYLPLESGEDLHGLSFEEAYEYAAIVAAMWDEEALAAGASVGHTRAAAFAVTMRLAARLVYAWPIGPGPLGTRVAYLGLLDRDFD